MNYVHILSRVNVYSMFLGCFNGDIVGSFRLLGLVFRIGHSTEDDDEMLMRFGPQCRAELLPYLRHKLGFCEV